LMYLYRAVMNKSFLIRAFAVLSGSAFAGLLWNIFKRHMELTIFGGEALDTFAKLGVVGYYTNQYFGLSFWIIILWSGLHIGLTLFNLLQEERATSLAARSMAHEAQLRMLRYQLNPHFLFNTLNAISTLILMSEKESANAMVSKLSNFLRYSLDKDPLQKVDLRHEVNTLKLYLEIEQVRFEERLKVEFDIDKSAEKAIVPSMLLQPLVENSIKYAVADREEGGTISIRANTFASDLVIEVQDDGPGMELAEGELPEFRGVGLRNTRERLEELYGSLHTCRITDAVPHGLKVEIRLPFEVS